MYTLHYLAIVCEKGMNKTMKFDDVKKFKLLHCAIACGKGIKARNVALLKAEAPVSHYLERHHFRFKQMRRTLSSRGHPYFPGFSPKPENK
jgi:hypothetical protein